MWGEKERTLVCFLQLVEGSVFLSDFIQDSLATLRLETEVVVYILAGLLFMYLQWIFTKARCVPKPPTSPPKPDGTRLSNRKKHQTLEILLLLSYGFTICCAKLYLWIQKLRFVCAKLYENKHCNPTLRPQSILSGSRLDLHDKNNQICGFERWLLMVSGTSCFSQLMLMHYPQLQEQHHRLASESINSIFLLKRNLKHHNVTPSAYPVSAKQRCALKIHHRWQREPNPVIGFTLSHNLRSVHF